MTIGVYTRQTVKRRGVCPRQNSLGLSIVKFDLHGIMQYVYVLQSLKNGQLYKGCISDLKRRLREHNDGKVFSTKAHTPWQLMYYQGFVNKVDALREEKFLKSGKGRERLKFLLENTLKS